MDNGMIRYLSVSHVGTAIVAFGLTVFKSSGGS